MVRNHIMHLLSLWESQKDDSDWVLGLVYRTEGSCYRKAGAMMLFNEYGEQLGMLSGGCLESDLQRNSRRVMLDGNPRLVSYDDSDEHDISFKLGVGCGGKVFVMLVPVNRANQYLLLDKLLAELEKGNSCIWEQVITDSTAQIASNLRSDINEKQLTKAHISTKGNQTWLNVPVKPPPHLLIAGGGLDAVPLAQGAANLGWQITLWEPRVAQGSPKYFSQVDYLLRDKEVDTLQRHIEATNVSAAVLMTHHRELDARALSAVIQCDLHYIALLGPTHRKVEIAELAGVSESIVASNVFGPAGLDIGAELPESIALSILAECHAILHHRIASSLSFT